MQRTIPSTRLDQRVRPLKASVRIAERPVGNPGTAGEKCAQLWVVTVGAGRVQRSHGGLRTALGERAEVSWRGLGAEAVYPLPSCSLERVCTSLLVMRRGKASQSPERSPGTY